MAPNGARGPPDRYLPTTTYIHTYGTLARLFWKAALRCARATFRIEAPHPRAEPTGRLPRRGTPQTIFGWLDAIEGTYRDYKVRYVSSHGPGAHKHSRFVCGAGPQ